MIIISIFIVFMLLFSSFIVFNNTAKDNNVKSNSYNENITNCSQGNYSFQYNSSNSSIVNLAYNNNIIANYITVSGKNTTLPFTTSMFSLKNETIFHLDNSLFISTTGNVDMLYIKMQFNKSLAFNTTAVKNKTMNFANYIQYEIKTNLYNFNSSNYSGYFMTSGRINYYKNNNTLYIYGRGEDKPLIIGFTLEPSLHSYIDNIFKNRHSTGSKLVNNNNNISGKYMGLSYSNGIFSNVTYSNNSIFNKLYVTGNGYMKTDFIKNNSLLLYNSLLTYFNNTVYLAMHNNPEMETNMFLNNGTLHLVLNKNETLYNRTFPGVNSSYIKSMRSFSNQDIGNNLSAMESILNFNHVIRGENAIYINDGNTGITLFMNNLNYTYSNNEINISSNGMLSFIVNPVINSNTYNKTIMDGILKGEISSEMLINNNNSTVENTTIYYNSSVNMGINRISSTNIIINVSSMDKSGTVMAFYVSKSVMNSKNVYVKFDNHISKYTTVKNIMNTTSKNTSYYTYINGNSYTYILIYIPHFSNHTVDITDVKPLQKTSINYYEVGVITIVIIAAVIASMAINKHKKINRL